MLAFALIHVELHDFAVRPVEGLVLVEDGLDEVVACGNIFEASDGVAEGGVVDSDGLVWLPSVDVHAEDDLSTRRVVDLVARLVAGISGEDKQETAIEWTLQALTFCIGNGEGLGAGGDGKEQK